MQNLGFKIVCKNLLFFLNVFFSALLLLFCSPKLKGFALQIECSPRNYIQLKQNVLVHWGVLFNKGMSPLECKVNSVYTFCRCNDKCKRQRATLCPFLSEYYFLLCRRECLEVGLHNARSSRPTFAATITIRQETQKKRSFMCGTKSTLLKELCVEFTHKAMFM